MSDQFGAGADRPAPGETRPELGALAGMRVLECCETTAGAYCGKLLSDLGAEVVSVNRGATPVPGDDPRNAEPAGRRLYLSTGKRRVEIDWETQEGARRLGDLCAQADVLIDDLGPGRSKALFADAPAPLIRCAISPFGATGPYAGFKASHLNVFHAGGEGHLLPSGEGWIRFPDRAPLQIGSDAGDFDTGANAAIAVLAAFRGRLTTGLGASIDVSAQESQLTLNRTRLSRFNHDGVEMRRTGNAYVAGGMFRCRDGWAQILGPRDEYWAELARLPGAESFADPRFASTQGRAAHEAEVRGLLGAWCAKRSRQEVVALLSPAGFAVGAFATAEDLVSSPQLIHRAFFQAIDDPDGRRVTLPGAPYKLSATPVTLRPPSHGEGFSGDSQPSTPPTAGQRAPLTGVRILDFTWAAAGPYATLLLALLGAEVIKVESTRRPDMARRGFLADYGGVDKSPNFNELNLNKRSFQVDLTDPLGLDLVHQLVPLCDVVVDNFRPGVMRRFGLEGKALLERYPRMIVGSSSANGSTGPEALTAGLASIFSATGGLSEQTGYADGPPTEIGESTDYRSGNAFALAILAALVHRDRTGQGQIIDVSSREVVASVAPDALLAHLTGVTPPGRLGNRHAVHAPHNLYPSAGEDDWISIAVTDEASWRGLCEVLERPDWSSRYASPQARKAHEDELDRIIGDWSRTLTSGEAFLRLQRRGVPSAPCFTNRQLAQDDHLAARNVFVDVEHPVIGRHRLMRAPWLFSDPETCAIRRHGPRLGEDNDYVLGELLQLSADARERVRAALR